jgi:hypothetical protein
MSSPGFEAPDLKSFIGNNNSGQKDKSSNLRAYWQSAKAYNDSEIHQIETMPERYRSEGDENYVKKAKLAIKSFPGNFGPTLDRLSAAYRKRDQNETKWLAHRALCISESRLKILNERGNPGTLKVCLEEINEILLELKTNGIGAKIEFAP